MKFGKQNNYKRILCSTPVILFLALLSILLILSVYKRFGVEREMAQRRNAVEQELLQLQQRKEQLQERVEYLEGERGIEEEIRKNFDVAKEGEQVIILTGQEEESLDIIDDIKIEEYPWYIFWK